MARQANPRMVQLFILNDVGVPGMAKQWDSLIKLLVEANKQDLVSLLLPGAKFERELNNAGKRDLLPLAYAFASLVFKNEEDRDWLKRRFAMLSEDIFEDSWAYQEMLAKGMEKGMEKGLQEGRETLRETIMDVVQIRFPEIAVRAHQRVYSIEDLDSLRRLNVKLSTAKDVQEAEQALLSNTPNGQQH